MRWGDPWGRDSDGPGRAYDAARYVFTTIRGRMAQLWSEYEFLRDGKFSHCGVDSVTLFKTAEGWKISAIAFTMETTGCPGR